ncbi:MAG: exonuclease subunit SbcD [Myxococcales bacterium]|nr:exonuclease subunit SbcD [Myxococcales bacterium]
MRLLHTSDWHLGASLDGVSREPDHQLFLDWLVATLDREAIDALVIAGDVFDVAQPSAEAQRAYFRFLANAARTGVRAIIVIGGNHDSASRLDAPAELLGTLAIHVVGGIETGDDAARQDRALCPVRDADGRVIGVVVAVPYVHEYRLGVRPTAGDNQATRRDLHKAFKALYKQLATAAAARWPGVPLVATGHLTAAGVAPGDYGAAIHQLDRLGTLPGGIFDPRYDYVALGHLHRSFRVAASNAWYSGSPIPLRLNETAEPRRVLRVELPAPGEGAEVTPLLVPPARDLVELAGPPEAVATALRALSSTAPLPPLVYARLAVESYDPGAPAALYAALDAHKDDARRPRLVSVRQDAPAPAEGAEEEATPALPRLRELSPEDVFRRVCDQAAESVDDALLAAFRELLHEAGSAASASAVEAATTRPGPARQQELLPLSAEEGRS